MPDVTSYMGIIYAGLIVTAAYNALAAFLRALGDSKSPLYFLIISAAINVLLDIVFIIYVGMGVEGCAYATVIAQAISAILCLIYIVKKFPILHLKKENFTVSFQELGKLLALGIPMALQFSITAIGVIEDIWHFYLLMHRRRRYWMWRRHISTQYSGAIRSLEASSYIETPCRDWAMVWCRWSVESLNWWQEPELSCW